jgi:RNA recognition motif-containing protein
MCNDAQVRLLKDKDTGQNKGYAFVTFMNEENAEKAIETLNDSEVKVIPYPRLPLTCFKCVTLILNLDYLACSVSCDRIYCLQESAQPDQI